MKIEAIYSHGRLEFAHAVRFKHDPVKIKIEVPDNEVELNDNPYNLPESLLQETRELQNIFAEIRSSTMPSDSVLPELGACPRIEVVARGSHFESSFSII